MKFTNETETTSGQAGPVSANQQDSGGRFLGFLATLIKEAGIFSARLYVNRAKAISTHQTGRVSSQDSGETQSLTALDQQRKHLKKNKLASTRPKGGELV